MRISFIWQGFSGRYGHWQDGLYAAMKLIEQEHEVAYFDVHQLDKLKEFSPDVVLYWEAPCTLKGKDADKYREVMNLPYKKALLFAGGPVERETCKGFDLYFVESTINEREFAELGLPWKRAFGVNTQIFKPISDTPKLYDAFMQATFADWKRHKLFAEAMGERGAVAGRKQEHDMNGYNACVEKGVVIFPELPAIGVADLINASHVVLNTAEFWGGGQRCTLEAMACGVSVIVMNDSPKNCEFVHESGFGIAVPPNVEAIRGAIESIKKAPFPIAQGVDYINSKWTEQHYANAILEGIASIL